VIDRSWVKVTSEQEQKKRKETLTLVCFAVLLCKSDSFACVYLQQRKTEIASGGGR